MRDFVQKNRIAKKCAVILFWIVVWALVSLLTNNVLLVAGPIETCKELVRLLAASDLYLSVGRTLLRIAAGFLAGMAVGVGLAALSKRFAAVEMLFAPMVGMMKSVPIASFVVLLLIWWGAEFLAVAICFLVVMPSIYINTLEGLKQVDGKLLEMARIFELPAKTRFFYITMPALRPFLTSAMKVSLGLCWKSGVAAEVIGVPEFSIGEQLYLSKIYMNTAGVFAWTAVIVVLSLLFEKGMMRLAEAFFAMQPTVQRPTVQQPTVQPTVQQPACGPGRKLTAEHLYKQFDDQQVLSDVSLVCPAGETRYLREPSGSGKTTLLRILAGLEAADAGEIFVPAPISMVFQEDRLCEAYSAVKNVEMVCGDAAKAREALLLLLDEADLDKPCALLSGGMKRRVALVRALMSQAQTLLLDEPFTGMDEATKARAKQLIEQKSSEKYVVIATHIV